MRLDGARRALAGTRQSTEGPIGTLRERDLPADAGADGDGSLRDQGEGTPVSADLVTSDTGRDNDALPIGGGSRPRARLGHRHDDTFAGGSSAWRGFGGGFV